MPYLKWLGGKRKLIDVLKPELIPVSDDGIFYDVFTGAGTIAEAMSAHYQQIVINDINHDLIRTHKAIHYHESFPEIVLRFFGDNMNTPEAYYAMRDEFNHRSSGVEKSALFIYLNKHGFNGMCRYNAQGMFNVPFGKYKGPKCPTDEMYAFRSALTGTTFMTEDFEDVMDMADHGDVVYLDPPYYPLSPTSDFTSYSSAGFTLLDQQRLAAAAKRSKAKVVVSNNDLPEVRELYSGARFITVKSNRSIAASGKSRGKVSELIAIFD